MQWLRLRPESPEELDMVDWKGRWLDDDEDYDDEMEEDEDDRQMEDFDPVRTVGGNTGSVRSYKR
jgi:casein kinase II subunit beta